MSILFWVFTEQFQQTFFSVTVATMSGIFLATAKLRPNAPQCAPMRPDAPRDEKNKEKLLCDV